VAALGDQSGYFPPNRTVAVNGATGFTGLDLKRVERALASRRSHGKLEALAGGLGGVPFRIKRLMKLALHVWNREEVLDMVDVSEIASLAEDWMAEIGAVEVGDAPRS